MKEKDSEEEAGKREQKKGADRGNVRRRGSALGGGVGRSGGDEKLEV